MTETATRLDAEEYLGLALNALRAGDHGAALAHLKSGAECHPSNAQIAYMLGAEHAQIGLFDRAEQEMARALEIEPGLTMARFQLGLLQLTQSRPADASATWAALDELPEGHGLRLFKLGLEALAQDRFADARSLLEQGIAANNFSADLNRDMTNVLGRIPEATEAAATAEAAPGVWLGAYRDSDQTH